jgi:hypothetical protein
MTMRHRWTLGEQGGLVRRVRSAGQRSLGRQPALIDAYERQSTANEHFLKLEAAVEALAGTSEQTRADHDPATPPTAE